MAIKQQITEMAVQARRAAREMAALSTDVKNRLLLAMADGLLAKADFIKQENQKDLEAGRAKGLSAAMLYRLELSDKVIDAMIGGLREVVGLPDPVGEVTEMANCPNGIMVGKMRIPLGVIGIIYESRPNVTVDAAALCIKAGNGAVPAVLIRGHSFTSGPCQGTPGGDGVSRY